MVEVLNENDNKPEFLQRSVQPLHLSEVKQITAYILLTIVQKFGSIPFLSFFLPINIFVHHQCVKLIKSNSEDMYNDDSYFK